MNYSILFIFEFKKILKQYFQVSINLLYKENFQGNFL